MKLGVGRIAEILKASGEFHAASVADGYSIDTRTLQPGDLYRIPGRVRHKVVVLDEPARALDIFFPVREEYR